MGRAEAGVFERGPWTDALEKYAAVTHLTVQLYDTDARLICGPVHPTALFELFTPGRHDLGIFAACIRRCQAQTAMPRAVVVEDHYGLAVVGTALTLGGEIVGAAVAGYALTAFLDQHALQRLARNSGRSFEAVWAGGRKERHTPRERLIQYGELLRTLADTLLAENVRTRREQQTSARLAEALQIAEAARATAEAATALVRRVQTLTDVALDLSLDDLLREMLTRVQRTLDTDTAVILLRTLGEETLRVRAALGLDEEMEAHLRIPIGRGFADRIATERRPLIWEREDDDEVESPYIRQQGVPSLAGVPLQVEGRVIGVLQVGSVRPRHFLRDEVELLRLAGDRIALGILRAAAHDATEQARATAEVANRAKDAFLGTVSHELRTPLSPILLWARMLRQGTLDEETRRRALETIERSAKSQAQIIEDLLDVSRIIAGKMRIEVRPVHLARVIEAAVEVVRPAAEAKGVRLQTVLDTEVGAVSGDPDRLQQVVWNLLSNAIKFTPKGGGVQVVLERVNSHVEIAVSDTGEGISPAFLPHVFERFQQANSSPSRLHSGLGLGLAIVRHIVELHGGSVRAGSPEEGRGAVVTVTLPLMLARTAGQTERRHPTASVPANGPQYPALDGVRVLVVDDEPDSNEVVGTLLSSCGAEVRVAASAALAREELTRWTADLLVSDVGMPGEDGYAFIATLRAQEGKSAQVPALALTAYASREDRIRLLSAGFQAHLAKPIDPAELVTVVATLARSLARSSQPP